MEDFVFGTGGWSLVPLGWFLLAICGLFLSSLAPSLLLLLLLSESLVDFDQYWDGYKNPIWLFRMPFLWLERCWSPHREDLLLSSSALLSSLLFLSESFDVDGVMAAVGGALLLLLLLLLLVLVGSLKRPVGILVFFKATTAASALVMGAFMLLLPLLMLPLLSSPSLLLLLFLSLTLGFIVVDGGVGVVVLDVIILCEGYNKVQEAADADAESMFLLLSSPREKEGLEDDRSSSGRAWAI